MATETLQHIATYCNLLQHIATYCNLLQHIATFTTEILIMASAVHSSRGSGVSPAFLAGTCGSIQGDRSWPASRVLHTKENHEGFSFFFRSLNHRLAASCTGLWLDFRCVSFDCCGWLLFFANVAVSVPFPVPTPVVDDEHVEDVVVGCCPCLRLRLQVLLLVLLWLYCFWDSPGHGGNQCGKQDMKRAEENGGWERLGEARQWVEVDCFYSSKILRRQELLKLLWEDDE